MTNIGSNSSNADVRKVVIISAFHDYRSKKRASIHHIAEGLVAAGLDVTFISMRFSALSSISGDSRHFLRDRANTVEMYQGVRCYLWRTILHPFASRFRLLDWLMGGIYYLYARSINRWVDQCLSSANTIVIESGVAAILLPRARRQSPDADIVYYAADRLSTVGAHPYIAKTLFASSAIIDRVVIRSRDMMDDFSWAENRLSTIGFGMNSIKAEYLNSNPYSSGIHIVSVGSMLFDPSFFTIAAPMFPDIEFHVIGCSSNFDVPDNVHIYDEMPFDDTLRYLAYATIGVAAYQSAPNAEYLADTSLKLAQYAYFGKPALCPHFAVGNHSGRIGYVPADRNSIFSAVHQALTLADSIVPRTFPSWEEVARSVVRRDTDPS